MLKSAYEGLNARPKVYLSKEYLCKMYPTCVSSKLCEFISLHKFVFFDLQQFCSSSKFLCEACSFFQAILMKRQDLRASLFAKTAKSDKIKFCDSLKETKQIL